MTLSDIQCCIIIPTYNNENTVRRVIDSVMPYAAGVTFFVVNDGSTDSTLHILASYGVKLRVLNSFPNRGKGYSLRLGFKEAIKLGYKYALTLDSDGQHLASDIPVFIEAALQHPGALLMGSRNMEQEGVPGKSSFGNKFSNFWFKFETGITLPDTQTGFRLYPLEPLKTIKLFTTKFETEIEVIVKMAWRQVPIIPVNINVIYDKNERVTHFRPFRDFTRISILNTWLVILTLLYYLPKRLIEEVRRKGLWKLIKAEAIKSDESNFNKARSIGFGFFMGIVPIWGFQLLVGIPLSIYFKMNKVLFLAAANISIPPMIPLIIFLSYKFGGLFYQNGVQINDLKNLSLESIHLNFVQYFLGGTLLAVAAGVVTFLISLLILTIARPKSTKGL
jgi:glycosyltransferase involved in cell wall biosynthesis